MKLGKNMKKLYLFIIYLFFIPNIIYSQADLLIHGTIFTENNMALPNANIRIVEFDIGTVSDSEGKYSIEIPSSYLIGMEIQIKVSYIGYKSQIRKVTTDQKSIQIDFVLSEDIFESEAVVVTAQR